MEHLIEILIPTLQERASKFAFIHSKLTAQAIGLPIKISWLMDNRERSIGAKRNELLQNARAKYACFVDDDDDVTDNYIQWLYKAALSDKDCASLAGHITFDGLGLRTFIHSIQYNHYFEDVHYYRPPNHLNLIKTEISKQFLFADKSMGEDTDWAMDIANEKALKTEFAIPEVIYKYKYITKK